MKKGFAIVSVATACLLLTGCSQDRADEIYAKLTGQDLQAENVIAAAFPADGLTDDQLPEGVEVPMDRTAAAVSDLTLYDAPSPVGGVVGTVPAGARVQVTGVVRRMDGSRWYDVRYDALGGYAGGGLDFSAAAEPTVEPTIMPEETQTPEPTLAPEETPTPEPTVEPEETPTPEPTIIPEETPTPEPTIAPEGTPTPEPTIAPEETPAPEQWPTETALKAAAVVVKQDVRLRAHPSTEEAVVATVDRGTDLALVSAVRMSDGYDWYGVDWRNGKAYVRGDMIEIAPDPTATPEPTIAPEETATPEPTIAPEETPTPEPTIAPEETATPEPTIAPEETATPEPTIAPEETATPEPTIAPEETATPEPTPTPDPAA
jgi:hypothetical protein